MMEIETTNLFRHMDVNVCRFQMFNIQMDNPLVLCFDGNDDSTPNWGIEFLQRTSISSAFDAIIIIIYTVSDIEKHLLGQKVLG